MIVAGILIYVLIGAAVSYGLSRTLANRTSDEVIAHGVLWPCFVIYLLN